MNDFCLGIVSGVGVSIVLYFLRYIVANLCSLLAGLFSREIRGKWKTKFYKNDESYEEYAEIKQLFHWVWGEIVYPHRSRKYRFKGTIHSNVIVATYEIVNERNTIDRGSFTLLINAVGKTTSMSGKYSWTDDGTQNPEADKYEWTRND